MPESSSQSTTSTIVIILFIVIVLVIIYDYYSFTTVNTSQQQPVVVRSSPRQGLAQRAAQARPRVLGQARQQPSNTVITRTTEQRIENYESKKTDLATKNVVKFVIYHMPGCGHCVDIMKNKQQNGKTKFEELRSMFANDNTVQILDFELGKDPEANKFTGFPEIHIITETGDVPYNGQRTVKDMADAIMRQKQ
jgi:hypothetical protein